MTVQAELDWKNIVHRCFRCGYCKFTSDFYYFNCPSYKKYRFETYSTGGRMWTIYGLISGEISWTQNFANVLYACPTCGNCTENCKFEKFHMFLVDFIEAAREEAVKAGFCPERQKELLNRTLNPNYYNPYGEINSDNKELREKHDLPEEAECVYFIGCTSNYRQKELRDATINFLKRAGINFTLIDEHCCCSPLIRTGQTEKVKDFINYNIAQFQKAGATKIITSCAGCYRTIKKDWPKRVGELNFQVFHTIEIIKDLIENGKLKIKSSLEKTLTFHDPCHLGRHMGVYEDPRIACNAIPGIKFVEMERNRGNAWCCGAGGGVKIGYPDWAVEVSKERLEEAKKTGAQIIASTCPFCKTNLKDANEKFEMGFEILDMVEIIDSLDYEVSKD